jgi:hypothetical protein
MNGDKAYQEGLAEIFRVRKPVCVFGLGKPMHHDVEFSADLVPLVTQGPASWADCFTSLKETVTVCRSVGCEISEADYAPDARLLWEEYAVYDPGCQLEPHGDRKAFQVDKGRWLSFGYVIAKKPATKDALSDHTRNTVCVVNPEKLT